MAAVKQRRRWKCRPLIVPPLTIEYMRWHAAAEGCADCAYSLGRLRSVVDEAAGRAIEEGPEVDCE